jgi:hypothetical protein
MKGAAKKATVLGIIIIMVEAGFVHNFKKTA